MKTLDLTDGSISRKLILFSLPMIAGNLLQQFYNLADTLIVGRFIGADALASVGSSYTLMTFLTSLIIGLCMGSSTFFSEDFGSSNKEKLNSDIFLSFHFILIVTVIITALIYPFSNQILHLLKIPDQLYDMTFSYVRIVFAGMFFIFLYNFFSFLLRSLGNSSTPLFVLAFSSILNIILDIYFITSLSLGIAGAALATVISQAISGIGITIYACRKLHLISILHSHVSKDRLKQIMIHDISTGMQQSVMNFGILMIQGLVNSFGTVIMASFAAAVKIDTIAYMPAQEFGNAYSIFISQNFGAKKQERIRKGTHTAFFISIIFCLLMSVFIFFSAKNLMQLFIDANNTAVVDNGVTYLRIEGSMYAGIGILFLWYGYFRAIEKPSISLLLTVISLGTRVLLSYLLAPSFGVTFIWLSIPVGWFLADITGLLLYRHYNH